MKLAKYREFVDRHPWFPAAVRPLIYWQDHGPGEENPDRATEVFFTKKVSHLGVVPFEKFDLGAPSMEHEKRRIRSRLLKTTLTVDVIRTFQAIFHYDNMPRFSQNHSMASAICTIHESIETYRKIFTNYKLDALVEETLVGCGQLTTHRFNVVVFPE